MKKNTLEQPSLCINIAGFIDFFYNIIIFNFPNQKWGIRIMQLLVLFDQLHVAVGITHFKLSTTFSKICFINCEQKMATVEKLSTTFLSNLFQKYKTNIAY